MNGLGTSEVKYSFVKKQSGNLRIDSGFYSKDVLSAENKITSKEYKTFGELISVLTDYTANGSFASLAKNVNVYENENYAKWIRIQNLDDMDYEKNIKFVDEHSYNFLKKSKLTGNELLISKTGEYLGKAYLFKNISEKCTLADNIFLIRLKNPELQNFIYAYINSRVGRTELLKWNQGTGQPTIIKESLRNVKIPIFSSEFINIINQIIDSSFKKMNESKEIHKNVEQILENNIGLIDSIQMINVNIKKKSETFDLSKRFDAEYYQVKYDNLLSGLKLKNNAKLGELVKITKSIEPGTIYYKESGIPFIRVSNLFEDKITETNIFLNKDDFKNLEKLFIKKDTILLSKDGSVGIAYKVQEDKDAVTSGAILHLKVKDKKIILPNYLTIVLNSKIVKLQSERDSNGAIIQHWKPSEIENVVIPILDIKIQERISNEIDNSFELRRKAEKLISIAKKSIEIAIEKSENEAIKYIKEYYNE